MNILDIILVGVALSMDAAALTIANCTSYKGKLSTLKEWSMPIAFAFFQILMPVIGFYLGVFVAEYISSVANYVTAGIFFLLALKIVFDNVKEIRENKKQSLEKGGEPTAVKNPNKTENFGFSLLIIQAVATSIDALAVGFTLSLDFPSPFTPSLIIGAVTFAIVSVSLLFGKYLGAIMGKYAGWVGAVILFALAIKNLFA